MRAIAGALCCISSLRAPLCRSPATSLITTKGSKNAAASSQALNVGAHMPISGEKASPTLVVGLFRPLASAYVFTALMKHPPTSGPIRIRNPHQAREANNSRHSFAISQRNVDLGEGKKHLFEIHAGRGTPFLRRQ